MLTCKDDFFFLPDGEHYLNCAYMSPLLRRAEEAGIAGIRRKRTPHTLDPDAFFEESDHARRLFARLINAPDPRRVAVVPSTSYGISIAARNIGCASGQNIVVAHEQFPSNVYAWRGVCERDNVDLRSVAPPEAGDRGPAWNRRLLESIDADTAIVALGNVHWADGTRFDLDAIGERARECGAALVVDGTQSVGALPFDVARIQPDAVVCSAYKWMLGPYSIGLAYFGPRYDDGVPLEETWLGRAGSEDLRGLVNYRDDYQPGAIRYDMGERSNFVLMPMMIAGLEQLLEWTPKAIQDYCGRLTADLVAEARELGFGVEDEAWRASHLFGLHAPDAMDLEAVHAALADRGVHVSLRGSALRISPNVYNDETDVAALREALRDVAVGA